MSSKERSATSETLQNSAIMGETKEKGSAHLLFLQRRYSWPDDDDDDDIDM